MNNLINKGLKFLLIGLLLNCTATIDCGAVNKKKETDKPNILFVLCDDLGYNDVGFNGSQEIKTPNLDKLAADGTIFTSAYVSHPFCGPSRASIMTGVYPHKIGSQFNLPANDETIGKGIPKEETFISKVLQDVGYYTGAIGKWHLGATEKFHPNKRGFDDFYGFLGGGHNYFPEQYREAYDRQKKAGQKVIFDYLHPLEHNGVQVNETEYLTDALSREAVRFVKEAKEKKQPFFLYLAYNAPHVPLEAKEEDMAVFTNIKDKDRRTYAGMVYAVDRGVRRVVDALKKNKQFDNTLIVFLSDNGGKLSKGADNYPLREGKGSACEGGYRVPMFFHWPSKIPAGNKYEYPISTLDFYPTFTAMAEGHIGEDKMIDGKDILSHVIKGENARENEFIYCLRHRTAYSDAGIRSGKWKALKLKDDQWALYDLEKDISETNDLSKQYPEVLKFLVEAGKAWSDSHIQPYWFHAFPEGKLWYEHNMPRFEETFELGF
ncbi:MAG: sulfatase-like hydrolase/transferase [Bacteroidales bacterium]|nr:sulfatase-like hydrolase/transferase [Bacteroidales bacterium]